MSQWQLSELEWRSNQAKIGDLADQVQEIHDAITGSTKRPGEPGVLETQRRQGDRLDGHEERMGEHDVAIHKLEARVEDLEFAPARAATQELEDRKAGEKALKQTAIGKAIELGLAAAFGGLAAAGALLAPCGPGWSSSSATPARRSFRGKNGRRRGAPAKRTGGRRCPRLRPSSRRTSRSPSSSRPAIR